MKKLAFSVAAIALLSFAAGPAFAQCSFDSAAKAKGIKGSMIRAMSACGGSITYPSPNSQTGTGGVPTCAPPIPQSANLFGAKGACKVSVSSKSFSAQPICDTNVDPKCTACTPDGSVTSCNVTSIKAGCKDIFELDGTTPIDEPPPATTSSWSLNTLSRATFDDRDNGDMTVIDFPVAFTFEPAKSGKLKLKASANAVLFNLFGAGSSLPPCTAIEVLAIKIIDPTGAPFASLGGSTL